MRGDGARAKQRDPLARRLWTYAILITLLGIAARAAWYINFKEDFFFRLGPDGSTYLTQAESYLAGAITDPDASVLSSIYREVFPPGYPLFLAGILKLFPAADVLGQREYVLATVRVVQWALAGATTLMTFALARRVLFGYSALIPPLIVTASIAMTDFPNLFAYETLLAFLLTGSLLLLVKAKEDQSGRNTQVFILLAGLAFSYGVIVQPRILIALPFIVIWSARAFNRRSALLLLIAGLLLPAGWVARNYAVFHEFVPISINGQASVYLDNVDPVGGDGFTPRAAPLECPRSELMSPELSRHFEWARCMQAAGFNEIIEHPGANARAIPDRLAALISPWNATQARGAYNSGVWDYHDVVPAKTREGPTFKAIDETALIVWLAIYSILIIAGVATLWVEGPASIARLIAIPLLTLPVVHLIFHAENRFRVPLLPIIAIASTLGLLNIAELLASRRRST
ncbi:MAG TPA: hypothetical protein VGO97_05055 [Solirubrobacterales bacterium]|nr:hypothetical protein [Solirubrobacterales bacterium]